MHINIDNILLGIATCQTWHILGRPSATSDSEAIMRDLRRLCGEPGTENFQAYS